MMSSLRPQQLIEVRFPISRLGITTPQARFRALISGQTKCQITLSSQNSYNGLSNYQSDDEGDFSYCKSF